MRKRSKLALVWDGGTESALSLFELKCPEFELVKLICLVEGDPPQLFQRPLPLSLAMAQASSVGLSMDPTLVNRGRSDTEVLQEKILALKDEGIEAVAFPFTDQEDTKKSWEGFLKKQKMKASFPLWGWDHRKILQAVTGLNYKAFCVAVDREKLSESFLGRPIDAKFYSDLPKSVNPLGSAGEFYTFVTAGLFFDSVLSFRQPEKAQNEKFSFLKLSFNQVMH